MNYNDKLVRVCFLINPLAGLGGPLGYKGSDGPYALKALRKVKRLIALERARRFIRALKPLRNKIMVLTASSVMGEDILREFSFNYEVVYEVKSFPTTRLDTINTIRLCLSKNPKVIIFVGGDGTARDVYSVVGDSLPILGVPAGVKMYSSVFAISPEESANLLANYINGLASTCPGEIVDIDEDLFRANKLMTKIYGIAQTICGPQRVPSSKQPTQLTPDERENQLAIARHLIDYNMISRKDLLILGPGSTVKAIADYLGLPKTLLGVDVYYEFKPLALDVDAYKLQEIVHEYLRKGVNIKIIVTPIGGQGFIFGRGNQQIAPDVIRLVGKKNIIVVATRSKMSRLQRLLVDTGDPEVDSMLKGFIRVVVDYGEEVVVRVD